MELDRSNVIDRLQSRVMSIDDFNFDHLSAPPLYTLLTQQDIDRLYSIAHSIKYSGNPARKYKMIDEVLKPRGFIKLSAGTNRVVYKHTEIDSIVLKVAYDDVGIKDNPREFINQAIFKPFVTKIFEVSPCGTVAVVERVIPITSREEFHSVAEDVYLAINNWFIGKYVMADIGTKFFMNWGIRRGFGVVLIDFPYCYELDGNKLYCSALNNNSPTGICDGLIDYDDGFNFLVCEKCGTRYRVNELGKSVNNKNIIIKGRRKAKMKVSTMRYGTKVSATEDNLGLKPETASVVVDDRGTSKPVGSLKVSTKYVETDKKKRKGKVNVSMGSNKNKGNSRGTVRSDSPTSKMKVGTTRVSVAEPEKKIGVANDISVSIDAPTIVSIEGYNEETKMITFKVNKGSLEDFVETNVLELPEELVSSIIESSTINAELSQALLDLNESESESMEMKKRNKKLQEEIEKYLTQISQLNESVAALNKDIEEKEKKIVYLEDKLDDTLVDKLRKEITDLQGKIKAMREAEEDAPETPDPVSKDVTLLEEKNKEIENLTATINTMTEELNASVEEVNGLEAALSKSESKIKKLQNTLDDKDAKISALEQLLSETNEKLDQVETKVSLEAFDWAKENKIYAMFENLELGASFIQGKVVPITTLVSDDKLENIPEDLRDQSIIIFPTGDEGYPNFVDQDTNIIAVTSINGTLINDIMTAPVDEESVEEEVVEMVEAPVGAVQQ